MDESTSYNKKKILKVFFKFIKHPRENILFYLYKLKEYIYKLKENICILFYFIYKFSKILFFYYCILLHTNNFNKYKIELNKNILISYTY